MNHFLFTSHKSSLPTLCVLFSLFLLTSSFPFSAFNGYQVNDLSLLTQVPFLKEANEGWSFSGLYGSNKTSVCNNNITILGGPGILRPTGYMKRFYSGFKAHDTIYFRINLYFLDDWQPYETVFIEFDDEVFTAGNISANKEFFPQDVCGDPSLPDLDSFIIIGKMDHFLNNVTVKIYSNVTRPASQVSFGIRNVSILIGNRSLDEAFDIFPQSCNLADIPIFDNECTCPTGTYLYIDEADNTTFCLPCHPSCEDCYGPSNTQCYACNAMGGFSYVVDRCITCDISCSDCTGSSATSCNKCYEYEWMNSNRTCTTTCDSPVYAQETYDNMYICKAPCYEGEFYYWNSTCSDSCPSPLSTSTSIFGSYCKLPCASNKFLSWNKTCLSTCPSPMVVSNFQDIVFPCSKPCATGEYYYPNNGSCLTTCPYPLVGEYDENKILRCNNPCHNISNSYYFYDYNLTCNATCPSPLKSSLFENITNICSQPCQTGEFYYPKNGSCLATCPAPLVSVYDQDGILRCINPCENSNYYYYYYNQTCNATCPSPLKTSLFQNITKICSKPCQTGYYYYTNNGSCLASCPTPLAGQYDQDGILRCNNPCENSNYYFYDYNQTCNATCPSPLKTSRFQNIIKFCSKPCSAGQYYYTNNGSCLATCPSPLLSVYDQNGILRCNHPCSNTTNYFYEFNQTCHNDCPFPLTFNKTFQNIVKICSYPCTPGSTIYLNGSCSSTSCEEPLVSKLDSNGFLICESPCATLTIGGPWYYYTLTIFLRHILEMGCTIVENYFAYQIHMIILIFVMKKSNKFQVTFEALSIFTEIPSTVKGLNQSCTRTCTSPSYIENKAFFNQCNYVAPSKTSGLAAAFDSGATAVTVSTVVMSVVGQSNPTTTTIAAFIKMLPYIRYIRLNYPEKLQIMLNNMNSSLVSFSLGMSGTPSFASKFPKEPLPGNFDEYNYHSSFIVNYWGNFTTIFIMLGAIILLSVVVKFTVEYKTANLLTKGLRLIIKWNFFLMVYCGNLDSVVLSTSLQLRNARFDSAISVLDVIVCVLMNALTFFIFGLALYIIHDIRTTRKKLLENYKNEDIPPQQAPEKKWQEFQLFFKGSKRNHWIRQIFIVPFLFRIYLFNGIISYLFDYPLLQTILICLLSILMLTYLLGARPFVSRLVLLQHTTDEILMMTVNTSLLVLAILENSGNYYSSTRDDIGMLIIVVNLIFNITTNIYMLAYVFQGLYQARKALKTNKKQGVLAWLTAFLAPFESGGMDLEVVVPVNGEMSPISLKKRAMIVENTPKEKSPIGRNKPTIDIDKKFLYVKADDLSRRSSFASLKENGDMSDEIMFSTNRGSPSTPLTPEFVFADSQYLDIPRAGKKRSMFARTRLLSMSHLNSSMHSDASKNVRTDDVEEISLSPTQMQFERAKKSKASIFIEQHQQQQQQTQTQFKSELFKSVYNYDMSMNSVSENKD